MTGTEIVQHACEYVKDAIDDKIALGVINDALAELGDFALIYEKVTGPGDGAVAGEWYELPTTTTNVVQVLDKDGEPYNDYIVHGNLICFNDDDDYTIMYRRAPAPLTDLSDAPEIHPSFHKCLVDYLIGWWLLQDNSNSVDGMRHLKHFEEGAARVHTFLRRRRTSRQVSVIR